MAMLKQKLEYLEGDIQINFDRIKELREEQKDIQRRIQKKLDRIKQLKEGIECIKRGEKDGDNRD